MKEIHLVETSASMRAIQKAKLHTSAERIGCALFWHDAIEDIPPDANTYTMLVAHEFFDALPFHLLEVSAIPVSKTSVADLQRSARTRAGKKSSSRQIPNLIPHSHP